MNHSSGALASILLLAVGLGSAGARPEQALPPPGAPTPYPGQPTPVPREASPKSREDVFTHLVVAKDPLGVPYAFHVVSGTPPEGAWLVVLNPEEDGGAQPLTAANVGGFFERIDTPEKALELTQLLSWGALIRSQKYFERILESLPVPADEQPSLRLEDLSFEVEALPRTDRSFDVAFTAFVMGHGSGASSHISRLSYHVEEDGRITVRDPLLYLKGPSLVSPSVLPANAVEREAQKEFERKRKAFLSVVFADRLNRIPAGFNRGWRGEGEKPGY